jgi:hypothetical protein
MILMHRVEGGCLGGGRLAPISSFKRLAVP